MDSVGPRIKEIRKELNLSQELFGRRLQVTKAHISKIELGHDKPSNMLIKLLCIEFGINEKWLRTGIGPKRLKDKISEKASGLYAPETVAGKGLLEAGNSADRSPDRAGRNWDRSPDQDTNQGWDRSAGRDTNRDIDPASEYQKIVRLLSPGGAEMGYIPFMEFPELIGMINYLQKVFARAKTAEDRMRLEVKFEILFPDYKTGSEET